MAVRYEARQDDSVRGEDASTRDGAVIPEDAAGSDAARADAGGPDGGAAGCSTIDGWGPPTRIAQVSSSNDDWAPDLAEDGLTLFFDSRRPGGPGSNDIWVAVRASRDDDFGPPSLVDELNTTEGDGGPATYAGGLRMIFARDTPTDSWDLFETVRPASGEPWGAPARLPISTSGFESQPDVTPDRPIRGTAAAAATASTRSTAPGGSASAGPVSRGWATRAWRRRATRATAARTRWSARRARCAAKARARAPASHP